MSRLSSAFAIAAAALGVAVCASACGPLHEGAAATVGSTRISVAALNSAAAKASATTSGAAATDRTTTLQQSLAAMIVVRLIDDGARQKGVTVSEADIQSFLEQQRQTNGSDAATARANGIALSDLHRTVYEYLLESKLGAIVAPGQTNQTALQNALVAYIGKVAATEGVSVNPRYGVWVAPPAASRFAVQPADAFSSSSPTAPAPVS